MGDGITQWIIKAFDYAKRTIDRLCLWRQKNIDNRHSKELAYWSGRLNRKFKSYNEMRGARDAYKAKHKKKGGDWSLLHKLAGTQPSGISSHPLPQRERKGISPFQSHPKEKDIASELDELGEKFTAI